MKTNKTLAEIDQTLQDFNELLAPYNAAKLTQRSQLRINKAYGAKNQSVRRSPTNTKNLNFESVLSNIDKCKDALELLDRYSFQQGYIQETI